MKVGSSIFMLMLPHQMSSALSGCSTIRLSFGLRPVFSPELVESAPLDVTAARSRMIPSSYNRAGDGLRSTRATFTPWRLRSKSDVIMLLSLIRTLSSGSTADSRPGRAACLTPGLPGKLPLLLAGNDYTGVTRRFPVPCGPPRLPPENTRNHVSTF